MKQLFCVALFAAFVVFLLAPTQQAFAQAGDTLNVYANGRTLDQVVMGDTSVAGVRLHHVYRLVSLDTTYLFDATMTFNTNITFLGVPSASTGRLPCIEPDVLPDNTVPGLLFTLNGTGKRATFKNLYLLGIAINNTVNYAAGQAFQVSADSIRLVVDNCIVEQWSQFAIGYSGSWDKFFITNSKFRNMTTLPNQWYVGELLRNQNYIGAFKTDSIVIRYNTMLSVSGYATAATGGIIKYYEFSHNNVVYTFKNIFFLDRVVNAKFNNNLFYCTYAGGQNKTEYSGGWDSFTAGTVASIITMGPLDSTTAAILLGHASTGNGDPAAELLRNVEVKNNDYFWPAAMTAFWTSWNDTAHVDSIYTPVWMNSQSVNMFTNHTLWPGFVQSGNLNVDPGFGASIPGALNAGTGNANGVGLLAWFAAVRRGTGTTETYGYKLTQVGSAVNWVPTWPVPETGDMHYSNTALQTGGTDGRPVGDPNWFGITLSVPAGTKVPTEFALAQNYPNPFNPATKIDFSIAQISNVQLKVYNVLGQEVATLVNEKMTAGSHTVTFDASRLASGVYFYKLVAGNSVATRKMLFMK